MRQPTKSQVAMFIAFVILIAGFFAYVHYSSDPETEKTSITGTLDYVKSKCSAQGQKIYSCNSGSYFCIDSASAPCSQTEGTKCDYNSPIYTCTGSEGCSDTDGGQDYYTRGIVAYQSSTYIDSCSGSTLTEYSCTQGVFTTTPFNCPQGCENGACVNTCGNGQVNTGETCTSCPSDVKCPTGTTCQGGSCINNPCQSVTCPDQCKSVNVLQHSGFCQQSSGQCEYSETTCPYGCTNAKCNSAPPDPCLNEVCGDGICRLGCERQADCPQDCTVTTCINGEVRDCQFNGKAGNQTCVYGEWGDCKVDDNNEEESFCSKHPATCIGTPIGILLIFGGGLIYWLFFRQK